MAKQGKRAGPLRVFFGFGQWSEGPLVAFNALAAEADTTAWRYAIDLWVDTQRWQTGGLDYALLPALILGDTLLHVPVRVSGEIIVTFSPMR